MKQESNEQLQILFVDLLHSDDIPAIGEALVEIVRDPAFRLGFSVCVDCRRLPEVPTTAQLAEMAKQTVESTMARLSRRIAIVADGAQAHAAASQFVGLLTGGLGDRTRVVADKAEALDWFES